MRRRAVSAATQRRNNSRHCWGEQKYPISLTTISSRGDQSSSQSRRGPEWASCSSALIRLEAHSDSAAVVASVPTITSSESQMGISSHA